MMQLASLSDTFGDLVIYRDLNAMDAALPRYAEAYAEMELPGPVPPRKLDMAYAQALAWLLDRAADARGSIPRETVYVGDTMLNDGGAFTNLRSFTGWPGWCFIGAEKDGEPCVIERDGMYQANRWTALAGFLKWTQKQGAALDAGTVAIFDIDKTALGARGRNDQSIDRSRLAAIEATLSAALGESYNQAEFRRAYSTITVAKYHPFTADNQDNVAYICLMLSAGMMPLETLLDEVATGTLASFLDLMARMEAKRHRLPVPVAALHDDIFARVRAGDLTPFKEFRRREYRETVDRMGHLPDDAPLAQRLLDEVCVTREVMEAAEWLKERGCMLVALSDKPDEATAPTPELAAQGYVPLHRKPTHVIGQSLPIQN